MTEKVKRTIVCVDDNPDILDIFVGYLEEEYNVVTFTDPEEALEYLRYFDCHVLILDIFMPEIDGLKVIEKLNESEHFSAPVIICSGGGESGAFVGGLAIDTALSLGATSAIMKPFSQKELLDKIRHLKY